MIKLILMVIALMASVQMYRGALNKDEDMFRYSVIAVVLVIIANILIT